MPLKHLLYKIICCCFFLVPLFSAGQSFHYNQYTTLNGLPVDNVYAAAQDANGFMWFATDFGISKFDGYRFVNYYKKNGMANKAVTDIVYAGGDSCLFLSYPNVLQSIHSDGKINTIIANVNFSLQQIVRHDSSFYYYNRGVGNVGFYQKGMARIILLDTLLGEKGLQIRSVFSLQKNGIGFCTNKGLYIQKGNKVKRYLPDEEVYFAIYNSDNTIAAVSNNRIVLSDANFSFTKTNFLFPKDVRIYHMLQESDSTIWFRGIDKGIYRLQGNTLTEMSEAMRLQNKLINKYFTDAAKNTWFCTDGAGVLFKQKNSFVNYETKDGLSNNKIVQLLQYKGDLIIGTSNGLNIKKGSRIESIQLSESEVGLKYTHKLNLLQDKSIGICMARGFQFGADEKTGQGFVKHLRMGGLPFTAFKGFGGWQKDSVYYVTNSASIIKLINNHIESSYDLKAKSINARKIYDIEFYDNKIWFGSDKGILFINNGKLTKLDTIKGQFLGEVFKFLVDRKGDLWIATENGLIIKRNDNFEFAPKSNSYGGNYCRAITEDNEGKIWCATWDGIFVTDGNSRTNYSTVNGIASKTCNAILFNNETRELYIGTDNGLCAIKKSNLLADTGVSKVFIECTKADTLNILTGETLNSSETSLDFYFNVPYYNGNDEIKYEYKLDDGVWVPLAKPVFFISDISSGHHNLYARAKVQGNLITKEDAVFSFSIKTPFYKRWWFWITVAVLFQGLLFWVINKYNKREREKKLAVQTQQAEYASLKQQAFTSLMNPHFIFNALNSVQYYVNRQDRLSANKYLSDFATLIRKSFDAAQKSFVTLDEELETIRLYLQLEKMRFPDKFDYTIHLSKAATDEDWMLPSMVLQPFLENAILHGLMPLAEKGQLTIEATAKSNTLYLTITDTGMGIAKSQALRSNSPHKSRGMLLIKERLELLSKLSKEPIQLAITELIPGAINPGTKITLSVPQEVYEVFQQQRKQS